MASSFQAFIRNKIRVYKLCADGSEDSVSSVPVSILSSHVRSYSRHRSVSRPHFRNLVARFAHRKSRSRLSKHNWLQTETRIKQQESHILEHGAPLATSPVPSSGLSSAPDISFSAADARPGQRGSGAALPPVGPGCEMHSAHQHYPEPGEGGGAHEDTEFGSASQGREAKQGQRICGGTGGRCAAK